MIRTRVLSPQSVDQIRAAMARYPESRSALLPALHVAQRQVGYLSVEAMEDVAEVTGLPLNEVASVASFYTMFSLRPVGRHVVRLCTNISCLLCGSDEVLAHLRRRLGVGPGETTPDGAFTLRVEECLAACDRAPAMLVNEELHGRLTTQAVDTVLDRARGDGQAVGD
ncbi:MAG: NADH-quinone oxidoreductase subunit NuoE [Armatimonadetes bacterium]|nr:NADH-quinone oxidoreductase subunit NuoE [Armatimonadota bacterium]